MATNMKHRKTRSQQSVIENSNLEQHIVKIIISYDQQIQVSVPSNCPLQIFNSLLVHKVSEFRRKQIIGFQTVPQDYNFDYRLSKFIGSLTKSISLKCLYKNIIQNSTNHTPNQLDFSSQYRINKYKICRCLSSGGFSKVFLVRNLLNGQFYAAKFMDKSIQVNLNRDDAIKNQFIIHKQLSHPYIVKMEQYIQTKKFYILIMEYCPGGQLFTLLKHNRYMQEDQAKVLFLQTLFALKYLHEKSIIFRDIKPQNILIDEKGNIKVADFGLAKFIRQKTNSYCGSVQYMAPQIVGRKKYSFQVDLYCMGALLYQILIGCPPFYNPKFTNEQTKFHIINSQVCFPNRVPLSEQVKDLIQSLLTKKTEQRLGYFRGINQILQHAWIGQIDYHKYYTKKIQCPFKPNLAKQHFQRQKGNEGKVFLEKILLDIKKCKRQNIPNKVQMKLIYNPQNKFKSKSLQSVKFSAKCNKLKNTFEQQIQNNMMNQDNLVDQNYPSIIHDIKTKNISELISKNKKKHSGHSRSLSKFSIKSRSKSKQISETLLVNHKSCNSSKRNSIYKKFLETNNKKYSNRLSNLSLVYQKNELQKTRNVSNHQLKNRLDKDFQFTGKLKVKQYKQNQNCNKNKLKKTKQPGLKFFKNAEATRALRQTFI